MTSTSHRREVEQHVQRQVEELRRAGYDVRWARSSKTGLAKARAFQTCGQYVVVRACGACGTGRAGSGIPTQSGHVMRCDMECCGFCGRYKADRLAHQAQAKLAAMPLTPRYSLVMITVTERSVPSDPAEYAPERLRDRIKALLAALRALWDPERHLGEALPGRLKLGKPISTGMLQRIELSENGAIHAHLLYYGPYRVKEQVESILSKAWPEAGFVDIKHIANDSDLRIYQASHGTPDDRLTEEERRINSGIREICKYTVKAPSPLDEDHLEGGSRLLVNPSLAAKYELATWNTRLVEWRGVLRGTPQAEAESEAQAEAAAQATLSAQRQRQIDDAHIACGRCGAVGDWHDETRPAQEWARECHSRGERALLRSRWEPSSGHVP